MGLFVCVLLLSSLPNQNDYSTSLLNNNGIFWHVLFFLQRSCGPIFSSIIFITHLFCHVLFYTQFRSPPIWFACEPCCVAFEDALLPTPLFRVLLGSDMSNLFPHLMNSAKLKRNLRRRRTEFPAILQVEEKKSLWRHSDFVLYTKYNERTWF